VGYVVGQTTDGEGVVDVEKPTIIEPGVERGGMRPCSLCGEPTEFSCDGPLSEWYLCSDCEGTPAAEAAGYTHRN